MVEHLIEALRRTAIPCYPVYRRPDVKQFSSLIGVLLYRMHEHRTIMPKNNLASGLHLSIRERNGVSEYRMIKRHQRRDREDFGPKTDPAA